MTQAAGEKAEIFGVGKSIEKEKSENLLETKIYVFNFETIFYAFEDLKAGGFG